MSVHEDDAADQLTSWPSVCPQGNILASSSCPTSGQPAPSIGLGLRRPSSYCMAPRPSGTALCLLTPSCQRGLPTGWLTSSPPSYRCYDDLRAALLVAHQLTAFQKAEKLFSSEPLRDRRPSELLYEMLEVVYPSEERSPLFAMLFLSRIPPHYPPAAHQGRPRGRLTPCQQGPQVCCIHPLPSAAAPRVHRYCRQQQGQRGAPAAVGSDRVGCSTQRS